MTPYELRFEIFKHATKIATDSYYATRETKEMNAEKVDNKKPLDYDDFPSYDEIEKIAEKINRFVSLEK